MAREALRERGDGERRSRRDIDHRRRSRPVRRCALGSWHLGEEGPEGRAGAASRRRETERGASELGRRNNLYYELSVSTPRRRRRERADPNARSPNPSRGAAGTPITVAWSRSALNIREVLLKSEDEFPGCNLPPCIIASSYRHNVRFPSGTPPWSHAPRAVRHNDRVIDGGGALVHPARIWMYVFPLKQGPHRSSASCPQQPTRRSWPSGAARTTRCR